MEMESLQELYVEELKDLYSAEKQIVKALPKMVKNATNPELKKAFSNHLEETEGHVERLEKIFEMLGREGGRKEVQRHGGSDRRSERAARRGCDGGSARRGIDLEGAARRALRDGRLRHRTHVRSSSSASRDQAKLLQQTLDEEGKANELLTQIAESSREPGSRRGRRGDRLESSKRPTGVESVATEGTRSRKQS